MIVTIFFQLLLMNFVVIGESDDFQSEALDTSTPRSQPRGGRSQNLFYDNFDTGIWDNLKWTRTSTNYVGINSDTSSSGSYSM